MKIRIGALRRIISEAVMSENRFSRTVNRLMSEDEARERAVEMGLDGALTDWLANEFKQFNDFREERRRDAGSDWDEESEYGVGENGRAALGQSWDNQYSELAAVMGSEDAWPDEDFVASHPEVEKVWNAFFEE